MSNFQNYFQRLYLNENLRRLHKLRGSYVSKMTAHYDKLSIWNSINCLLQTPSKGVQEAKIDEVRRRLFREPKNGSRKLKKPKRKTILFSKCVYFKVYRHLVGKQKIQRNFLDIPRPHLYIEQLDQAMYSIYYTCRDEAQPYVRAPCSVCNGEICRRCRRYYLIGLDTSDNTRSKIKEFEEAGRYIGEIKAILKTINNYANTTVDDGA